MATCPICFRYAPPCPDTGYDDDDPCSAACAEVLQAQRDTIAGVEAGRICYFCQEEPATTTAPEWTGRNRPTIRSACADCARCIDEAEPGDHETMNGPGTEGGINYDLYRT